MDLSKLSAQELRDELAKRANEKKEVKQAFKELSNETVPILFKSLKEFCCSQINHTVGRIH